MTASAKRARSSSRKKRISLALQGDGSHGAFTWGVLEALLEDGRFEFAGLSGTSAGGMNAAAMVQGLIQGGEKGAIQSLEDFWRRTHDLARRTAPMFADPNVVFVSSAFGTITGVQNSARILQVALKLNF